MSPDSLLSVGSSRAAVSALTCWAAFHWSQSAKQSVRWGCASFGGHHTPCHWGPPILQVRWIFVRVDAEALWPPVTRRRGLFSIILPSPGLRILPVLDIGGPLFQLTGCSAAPAISAKSRIATWALAFGSPSQGSGSSLGLGIVPSAYTWLSSGCPALCWR